MLSFTAIAEVTVGEFSASPHRQAPVTGVVGTGAVNALSLGADQAYAATGVAAIGQVTAITNATVDADANITPTGVVGTSAAGSGLYGNGYISTTPTGVAGTSAVTANSVNVTKQLSTLVGTSGVGVNNDIINVSVKANITLGSLLGTTSINNSKYNVSKTLTGVAGTSVADWRDDDSDIPNGIYRAAEIVFLNTDFRRSATVNVVPYKEYKVYISK
tara:strand:- start:506 stop:1156 length:651 start_codon:yes stop_codon:yes gene_type:complete